MEPYLSLLLLTSVAEAMTQATTFWRLAGLSYLEVGAPV